MEEHRQDETDEARKVLSGASHYIHLHYPSAVLYPEALAWTTGSCRNCTVLIDVDIRNIFFLYCRDKGGICHLLLMHLKLVRHPQNHNKDHNKTDDRCPTQTSAFSVIIQFIIASFLFCDFYYSDVWKISIFLGIIQTIPHNKIIGNTHGHIMYIQFHLQFIRFQQQGSDTDLFRFSSL